MAHESGESLEIARAPKERKLGWGDYMTSKEELLSKEMVELAGLKRRVDILMDNLAALKQGHRALLKRFNRERKLEDIL